MGAYIARRILITLPLLLAVSFLTFLLISFSPVEPAEVILRAQEVPLITDELIERTNEELGLDKPFIIQYFHWLISSLQLDFGNSYVKNEPVWNLVGPAFINTFKLTVASTIVIIIFSVLIGVICAVNERKMVDRWMRTILFVFTATPSYLLGAVCIYLFSVKLDLLPTSGMEGVESYILPVLVTSLGYIGIYFRNIRSAMINNLNEDYVLYGRASGLSEYTITWHILRNSLQVAVSIFCMAIPLILGGTVVIENVFAWPGLGSLSIGAILNRDFPIIQAYVLIVAVAFVIFNMISDILNAMLNPRIRNDS
ncbi:nickel/cobalt ABC transporter permease [Ureibacillus sinduriensis]|uniref:Nickel transporter permease NikB n=1 Tax=Ureibacillus sinduriensis BLB-1 = JCM 15800 TaxID=1384057 RepID=A0A0A3I2T4_9BACL|nr:nickel/cobalt ABC transporter permease [Ureibacillus sinduriensis]KGR76973.1 nickel transporter permease NikB [Ureibacillus sinduriensis BLB-1 = JCM 15800]